MTNLRPATFIFYMKITRRFLAFLFLTLYAGTAGATHNRAGDITYVQIGPLTIRLTVTTYTKASSTGADRDSVTVFWGDGHSQAVYRINGPLGKGEILQNDTKRNFYVAEHTYPGTGTYTVTMTDPNRVGNILNLNYPNSVGIQFHLATTLTLLNSTIQGYNNSAVLLQPPIDFGCIDRKFIHNLNAYDPDGDSLAYELIVPFQATGSEVPNYRFPDQIVPGADNKISLDRTTGNFEWISPQREGEYNIAILIKEYRNGILLNTIIRDMQITIENCSNEPPSLTIPKDFCIIAGTKLEFQVQATDNNLSQKIAIFALGGPFNVSVNKAIFDAPSGFQNQIARGTFSWQTSCEHISDIPYTVVFRAIDNFKDSSGLADLKTVRIKVIGPPPENVSSNTSNNNLIRINWTYPNACAVTVNDYFKGFSVWRKINSSQFLIDTCTPGLAGRGYTRIASNVRSRDQDTYYFEDDMVESGKTHCYRILAEFALTSPGGNSYNRVASLPSEEICVQLKRDLPFITKATVNTTDPNLGEIEIHWSMPLADDLDTLKNKGPYKIVLLRADGIFNSNTVFTPVPGAVFTSEFFKPFTDTAFLDRNLATSEKAYSYLIQFFTGNSSAPYGLSFPASTVFTKTIASDRQVFLSWEAEVPWNNYNFEIFRRSGSGGFELVGSSTSPVFRDRTVNNNSTYCYRIRSIGTYGISGLPSPILNFSQEVCAMPLDTVPPCIPELSINRNCITKEPDGSIANELVWRFINTDTCFIDDLRAFNIYFKSNKSTGAFKQIATLTDVSATTFKHIPDSGYTGCYVITTVDFNDNESRLAGEICPANCNLEYELANTFTPNGDGSNDLFIPRINAGVLKIEFQIYNRWGEILFETEDPQILWNGQDKKGRNLSEGTYYYICRVFGFQENTNQVIEERKGFIQIIR